MNSSENKPKRGRPFIREGVLIKRFNFTLDPSIVEKAGEISYMDGISLSQYVEAGLILLNENRSLELPAYPTFKT